jgi:PKD repeat protein
MNFLQTPIRYRMLVLLLLATSVVTGQINQPDYVQNTNYRNQANSRVLQNIRDKNASEWSERQIRIEKYANENRIQVRRELPDGNVIELVDVTNDFPWFYSTHNSGAATTTRADKLYTGGGMGLNLDGSSLPSIGVWDAGSVLTSHQEFDGRVIQADNSSSVSNHATHVSGTLIAKGVTAKAKGMAYGARLNAYDWTNDNSEMAEAAAGGMVISSHSYGYTYGWNGDKWYGNPTISKTEDYRFGFYSSYTKTWDDIAYNAPYYLIVKSAGNDRGNKGPDGSEYPADGGSDGFDCIGTDAVGKNVLTVGAVNQVSSYTSPSSVSMYAASSWGPVDDGRIKPDVVGKGVFVYSTSGSSNSAYATMNGTSMATPNVAGTLALLQEHYMNLNGNPMRSATLKGLVIHTADETGPAMGPDYMYGWGLVNGERAASVISARQVNDIVLQELQLKNGGSYQLELVSNGTEPLKASIVWTDPAGSVLSPSLDPTDRTLVNDLDLRISKGTSNFYPWSLDPYNPSAAANRNMKNYVDNVEVVLIENPAPGNYTLTVSHEGYMSSNQNFSLIITGATQFEMNAPVADFSADKRNVTPGESIQFTNKSTQAPNSFKWEFTGPATLNSTLENPKVSFTQPGTYSAKLTVSNTAGSDTKTVQNYISVNAAQVQANFTASATSIMEGASVNFTDQSANNPTQWNWSFEGGTPAVSTQKNPSVTFAKAGSYGVTLKVSNDNSTDEIIKSGYIQVSMPAPVAAFTAGTTNIMAGSSVQFTSTSTNATSYSWSFEGGNPSTSTQANPSVQYPNPGTFAVTLTASNASGSDTQVKSGLITVTAPAMQSAFSLSANMVTEGETVAFSDQSTGNPSSWYWTFEGGTPASSTAQNPSVKYANAGKYDVSLKVSNAYGNHETVMQDAITVLTPAPIALFSASATQISAGDLVSFTNKSSNATQYAWTFEGGNPSTSNAANPTVTYAAAGTFSVTLKASNESGSDTYTKTALISVKSLQVVAEFSASATQVVAGETVNFSDMSLNGVTTREWVFEGGSPATSNQANPAVTYQLPGTYDVQLKVSNADGSDIITKAGYIQVSPKAPAASFMASATEIFAGEKVNFTNRSENAQSYVWTFAGGNPATSTEVNPQVAYATPGTYSVSLQAIGTNGFDTYTANQLITVKASSTVADFTASHRTIMAGGQVSFTDQSTQNPTSWDWTFEGGSPATSNAQNPTVTYSEPGTYAVSLKATNAGGSHLVSKAAYITVVREAPIADFTASVTEITAGESVQFTSQAQRAETYQWTFEGGSPASSSLANPSVNYMAPGQYTVKLQVSNESGSDIKTRTALITVKALSTVADFSASHRTIQAGSQVSFTDQSTQNPTSWNWTFTGGSPATSTAQNPTVTYNEPGTYAVSLNVTNAGGTHEVSRTGYITVVRKAPVAAFTASTNTILAGESVSFGNQSTDAVSFEWTFEGGSPATSNLENPEVVYAQAGTYSVQLKVTNESGSDLKVMESAITVKNLPVEADFSVSETNIMIGESITFTDFSRNNPTSWEWTFEGGSPLASTEQNPVVKYEKSGIYDVTLRVSNADGSDEIIHTSLIVVSAPATSESRNEASNVTTEVIDRAEIATMKAYPNPASDQLTVRLSNWNGRQEIRMTDLSGRTVFVDETYEELLTINVSEYNRGLYILTVTDGISVNSTKVTVH